MLFQASPTASSQHPVQSSVVHAANIQRDAFGNHPAEAREKRDPVRSMIDRFNFGSKPPAAAQPPNANSGRSSESNSFELNRKESPSTTADSSFESAFLRRQGSRGSFDLSSGSSFLNRASSLKETKVLMATDLKRTDSMVRPQTFQFDQQFEFQELIGKSTMSEVWRVRHKISNELFAVKRSRMKFTTKSERDKCMQEIRAVQKLDRHDNIVGQYRAWQQHEHFYIQMDLCEGGSLQQLLAQAEDEGEEGVGDAVLWQVAAEVAAGLAHLHSAGILHLDVKPGNVFADGNGGLRLGDFGLAVLRHLWDWEEGDGDYVAPELLDLKNKASPAADMFSLGATLFECAVGRKLPRGVPQNMAIAEMQNHSVSQPMQNMVAALLNSNPDERPSAQVVAQQAKLYGEALACSTAASIAASAATTQQSQAPTQPRSGFGEMAQRLAAIGLDFGSGSITPPSVPLLSPSMPTCSPVADLLARRTPPKPPSDSRRGSMDTPRTDRATPFTVSPLSPRRARNTRSRSGPRPWQLQATPRIVPSPSSIASRRTCGSSIDEGPRSHASSLSPSGSRSYAAGGSTVKESRGSGRGRRLFDELSDHQLSGACGSGSVASRRTSLSGFGSMCHGSCSPDGAATPPLFGGRDGSGGAMATADVDADVSAGSSPMQVSPVTILPTVRSPMKVLTMSRQLADCGCPLSRSPWPRKHLGFGVESPDGSVVARSPATPSLCDDKMLQATDGSEDDEALTVPLPELGSERPSTPYPSSAARNADKAREALKLLQGSGHDGPSRGSIPLAPAFPGFRNEVIGGGDNRTDSPAPSAFRFTTSPVRVPVKAVTPTVAASVGRKRRLSRTFSGSRRKVPSQHFSGKGNTLSQPHNLDSDQ